MGVHAYVHHRHTYGSGAEARIDLGTVAMWSRNALSDPVSRASRVTFGAARIRTAGGNEHGGYVFSGPAVVRFREKDR